MDNISIEIKKKLLEDELARYENTSYLWTIRHKIAEKTDDKAMKDLVLSEMEKTEKVIDLLQKEIDSLEG